MDHTNKVNYTPVLFNRHTQISNVPRVANLSLIVIEKEAPIMKLDASHVCY